MCAGHRVVESATKTLANGKSGGPRPDHSTALDATDISFATAITAEKLIVAVLPFHTDWSVRWLATLVKERGQIHHWQLEDTLNDAEMLRHRCCCSVLPSWDTRERHSQLIMAAGSLGRRMRDFPQFVTILEGLALHVAGVGGGTGELAVIARHRRDRFGPLVVRLIKEDPSWITQGLVYDHLHRRRQDLLTPFLGRQAYHGRFSTGRTRFVLPVVRGFHKWTPSQQTTFAATLEEVTRDSERRDSPSVLMAIGQLASLPEFVSPHLPKRVAISRITRAEKWLQCSPRPCQRLREAIDQRLQRFEHPHPLSAG